MSDQDIKPTHAEDTTPPAPELPENEEPISLTREFFLFIIENKKWWMVPLILFFLILMLVVLAQNTPLMPFIYSLM